MVKAQPPAATSPGRKTALIVQEGGWDAGSSALGGWGGGRNLFPTEIRSPGRTNVNNKGSSFTFVLKHTVVYIY